MASRLRIEYPDAIDPALHRPDSESGPGTQLQGRLLPAASARNLRQSLPQVRLPVRAARRQGWQVHADCLSEQRNAEGRAHS